MTKTYRVTLRYPDGQTMFVGTVMAEEIVELPKPSARNGGAVSDGGEKMTDPQKRYLFRLLAAQGVSGKGAEDHLKQYFRVGKLADIEKAAASDYINQLVKDKQDATNSGA